MQGKHHYFKQFVEVIHQLASGENDYNNLTAQVLEDETSQRYQYWLNDCQKRIQHRREEDEIKRSRVDKTIEAYQKKAEPALAHIPNQLRTRLLQDLTLFVESEALNVTSTYGNWLRGYLMETLPSSQELPEVPDPWSELGLVKPVWFTAAGVEDVVWYLEGDWKKGDELFEEWKDSQFQEIRASVVGEMWESSRHLEKEADRYFEESELMVEGVVRQVISESFSECSPLELWRGMLTRRLKLLARAELLGEWPSFLRQEVRAFCDGIWNESDRELFEQRCQAWDQLDTYRKKTQKNTSIISFRQRDSDTKATKLGGAAPALPEEIWPMGISGGPMEFLASFNLQRANYIPDALKDIKYITIFIDSSDFLFDWKEYEQDPYTTSEGRYLVRTYRTKEEVDRLTLQERPAGYDLESTWVGIPCVGEWEPTAKDYPSMPLSWDHTDLEEDTPSEFWRLNLHRSKIGGYPSVIQFDLNKHKGEEFVLQITSECCAELMWYDNGVLYLFYNKEKDLWRLDCQFY